MVTPKTDKRLNVNESATNNQVGKSDKPEGLITIKITVPGVDINVTKVPYIIETEGIGDKHSKIARRGCIFAIYPLFQFNRRKAVVPPHEVWLVIQTFGIFLSILV